MTHSAIPDDSQLTLAPPDEKSITSGVRPPSA